MVRPYGDGTLAWIGVPNTRSLGVSRIVLTAPPVCVHVRVCVCVRARVRVRVGLCVRVRVRRRVPALPAGSRRLRPAYSTRASGPAGRWRRSGGPASEMRTASGSGSHGTAAGGPCQYVLAPLRFHVRFHVHLAFRQDTGWGSLHVSRLTLWCPRRRQQPPKRSRLAGGAGRAAAAGRPGGGTQVCRQPAHGADPRLKPSTSVPGWRCSTSFYLDENSMAIRLGDSGSSVSQ